MRFRSPSCWSPIGRAWALPSALYEVMRCAPSTRYFTDEPVPRELLHRVLDNARYAPSGGNRQGWRMIVVTDRDTGGAGSRRGELPAPRRAADDARCRRVRPQLRLGSRPPGPLRRARRAGDRRRQPGAPQHRRRRLDLSVRAEHPAWAAVRNPGPRFHAAADAGRARGPRAAADTGRRRRGRSHLGGLPFWSVAPAAAAQPGRRFRLRRALRTALVDRPAVVGTKRRPPLRAASAGWIGGAAPFVHPP